jgi:hypothetical protein
MPAARAPIFTSLEKSRCTGKDLGNGILEIDSESWNIRCTPARSSAGVEECS